MDDPPTEEGVGDRGIRSIELADSEKERDKNEVPGRVAGTGVDTPRALASMASRWGGRGDLGGRHVGDKVLGEVGDRRDWRGVSFMCNSFAAVDMLPTSNFDAWWVSRCLRYMQR